MLADFIFDKKLLCHKDNKEECETKPIMCKYMNDCNGNGVCGWDGKCKCNAGYKSADCSEKVEALTNGYSKTFNFNGT